MCSYVAIFFDYEYICDPKLLCFLFSTQKVNIGTLVIFLYCLGGHYDMIFQKTYI